MGRTRSLISEAVRHQVRLERVGASLSSKVAKASREIAYAAVRRLSEQEEDVVDSGTGTLNAILDEIREADSEQLILAIEEMVASLSELADYEAGYTASQLKAISRGVRIKSLKAGRAYQAAIDNPITATGDKLEAFVGDLSDGQVSVVSKTISKGYSEGLTNQEIIRSIRGTKALNYSDGIVPQLDRNSEAVVKTSIQHVANTARSATWAENSDVVVGYKILATLDGKTSAICRSLDGKEYKIDKGPVPPLHVRCRSTTVPVLAKEFAFLDEGETRSSKDGYVESDLTFYEWLKTQDKEFQDEVLGPSRGKLFRDGGIPSKRFGELNLGKNFSPLTLEEMKKLEPEAFARAGL